MTAGAPLGSIGFNLSRVSDTNGGVSDWNEQVQKASTTTDRNAQATAWQDLNKLAMTTRTQVGVWASEHGLAGARHA